MNILISGASGFIGSHLAARLSSKGHSVKALRRQDYALPAESFASRFEGADAVINLSGADIAARWSEEYKKEIYESRVGCTRKIVEAIKSLPRRPRLLINASATGIYESGLSHDEYNFRYGGDFLAKLCGDWEAAALEARESGVRTVIFRFSVVLDKSGGALKKNAASLLARAGRNNRRRQPIYELGGVNRSSRRFRVRNRRRKSRRRFQYMLAAPGH